MNKVGVYIEGMDEMNKLLDLMPQSLAKSVMMRSLRLAAKPMRTKMRSLAPTLEFTEGHIWAIKKGSGYATKIVRWGGEKLEPSHLKKSIGILSAKKDKYHPAIWVGPRIGRRARYNAFYRHWVEYPTEFGRLGTPGIPFIRPAYDQTKDEVKGRLAKSTEEILLKVIRKKAPKYLS